MQGTSGFCTYFFVVVKLTSRGEKGGGNCKAGGCAGAREAPDVWLEIPAKGSRSPELGPAAAGSLAHGRGRGHRDYGSGVTKDRGLTPASRARRPLCVSRATGTPTPEPSDAGAANKQLQATRRPSPARAPRPAHLDRPRPRARAGLGPGPPAPPAGPPRHLPEVGGRGAQRGEQQRQREGRGQPARQQGPIQHLAAPRRLTIALPAPRWAPRGRRPLIAPGAPGRGRGAGQLARPRPRPGRGHAGAGGGPKPEPARSPALLPPGRSGPRARLARGKPGTRGAGGNRRGRKGRERGGGPGKGASPRAAVGVGGAKAECWWPGARRRGWRCAARRVRAGEWERRRNLEVGGPVQLRGRGVTWGGAGAELLASTRAGGAAGDSGVSPELELACRLPEEFA